MMERILRSEREHGERLRRRQNRENYPLDDQPGFIESYPGDLPRFSSRAISRLTLFCVLKQNCSAWEMDMQWLQRAWKSCATVDLFSLETSVNENSAAGGRNKICAAQVMAKYRNACFQTEYLLPSSERSIPFDEIVGSVARDLTLNDSVVLMCLQALCDTRSGVKLMTVLVNMEACFASNTS